MIIPIEQLAPEILENILKDFVLREGTEYGAEDISIEDKVAQVRDQLISKTAVIVYSELHETINIMPIDQFKQSEHSE